MVISPLPFLVVFYAAHDESSHKVLVRRAGERSRLGRLSAAVLVSIVDESRAHNAAVELGKLAANRGTSECLADLNALVEEWWNTLSPLERVGVVRKRQLTADEVAGYRSAAP